MSENQQPAKKVLATSVFSALDEAHTDVSVIGFKGIINSITAQILIAVRQHVQKQRRVEVPEDLKHGDVDLRNEHDNWLEGLQFSDELTEVSGHVVAEPPLIRASKLLAVRADVILMIKPILRTSYDAPQTFTEMAKQMLVRETDRLESGQAAALAKAKNDGRNVEAMIAQNVTMLNKSKARAEELMSAALLELKGLEPAEDIDTSSDLGVILNARMWTAALNAIGMESDRAYLRGCNVAYSDNFRRDQLAIAELMTREGVRIVRSYQGWVKANDEKITEASNSNLRMPELRQDWKKLEMALNPAVPA